MKIFKSMLLIVIIAIGFYHCEIEGRDSVRQISGFSGPFFGLKAPVDRAEIFMDGVISIKDEPEMCGTFAFDGKYFFYNALSDGEWTIFYTGLAGSKWSAPEAVNFSEDFTDRDFTLSPDSKKIWFGSNRPLKDGEGRLKKLDIFVSEFIKDGVWSKPKNVGPPVNSKYNENYPCVASNGNLYFFSCGKDGHGGCDIYKSEFRNGRYQEPVLLSSNINSEKNDWDAYIAPDESYIIFSSQNRADTYGGQDLYISFHGKNGKWSEAVNMGAEVNSESSEICPNVSTDGKFFFFTSRRRGKADIFWMDAAIIGKLKKANPQNK